MKTKKKEKSFEVLKAEARMYFGARFVETGGWLHVWCVRDGKLSSVPLCGEGCTESTKAKALAVWLHDAVDSDTRNAFEVLPPLFEGRKWSLTLQDYTATLKYTPTEEDAFLLSIGVKGEYTFPMTPEAALELLDMAAYADMLLLDDKLFHHLVKWSNN